MIVTPLRFFADKKTGFVRTLFHDIAYSDLVISNDI